MRAGKVAAAYTLTYGGIAEAIYKMSIGNGFGFDFEADASMQTLFGHLYGAFLLELTVDEKTGTLIGTVSDKGLLTYKEERVSLATLSEKYEGKLESVYPCNITQKQDKVETVSYTVANRVAPKIRVAKPRVLIPVFPGTNCEFDSAKAFADAGADPEIFVIRNLSAKDITDSVSAFASKVKESQIVFVPGGFSGGDEPDGSGKFITAFFRNAAVRDAVIELLEARDGLMAGICNGFQALIKLGLVPYGKIIDTDSDCPTLTFNTIGRHQSRIVRTRVASNKSPWLSACEVGDVYNVAISHGEGRFYANDRVVADLIKNGHVATQYVDLGGNASVDIAHNPNNSTLAIEGITSPDGRVFGKMGHSERIGAGLYQNVPGNYDIGMFQSAVKYYNI